KRSAGKPHAPFERRTEASVRATERASSDPTPLRQANGLPRPGAWTGKGASGQRSAGGKHGGYSRSRVRVNATTADSGACAASPADGIHFPQPPPRLHLVARGLLG